MRGWLAPPPALPQSGQPVDLRTPPFPHDQTTHPEPLPERGERHVPVITAALLGHVAHGAELVREGDDARPAEGVSQPDPALVFLHLSMLAEGVTPMTDHPTGPVPSGSFFDLVGP